MYKIYKLSLSEPVDFAASELKKYLRMMMPDCGEIDIAYDPNATDGFRLGLLQDLRKPRGHARGAFFDGIWYRFCSGQHALPLGELSAKLTERAGRQAVPADDVAG